MACECYASMTKCVYCVKQEADMAALQARVAALTAALDNARRFMDETVRAWLPREHLNCAIDSGCSHGAVEREMLDALEAAVQAALDAARGA